MLSKILSQKKSVSLERQHIVLKKIGASSEEIKIFGSQLTEAGYFFDLNENEFNFLSDWLPSALLELAKTDHFSSSPVDIAKTFSVHVEQVKSVIDLLIQYKFIEVNSDQSWVLLKPNNTWTKTDRTSEARRLLQVKLGELSLKSLEKDSFEDREHGSLTIAINKNRIPLIKEKFKKFRHEIDQLLKDDESLEDVYQITMALFPLSDQNSIQKLNNKENENENN